MDIRIGPENPPPELPVIGLKKDGVGEMNNSHNI